MRINAAVTAGATVWLAALAAAQTAPSASRAPSLAGASGPSERRGDTTLFPAEGNRVASPRADALGDPLPPGAVARLGTVRLRQLSPAFSVAFSPEGNSFATGQGDGAVCIWDRATGRLLRRMQGRQEDSRLGQAQTVFSLLYVTGDILLAGSGDGSLRWWDANSGAEIHKAEATSGITAIALGITGKTVLAASARGLQIYDIAAGERLDEIVPKPTGRPGEVSPLAAIGASLAVIPRDDRVILGGRDGNIHFFHLPSRKETSVIPVGVKGPIALAVSPDGRTLAWGDAAGKVRTMDLGMGTELKGLVGHTASVCCLAFSPDGTALASRAADDTIRLWNLAGKELWQAPSCGIVPNSMAFSPDGRCLAAARVDKTVDLLDAATGKPLFDLPGHTDQVQALAVSPDGLRLASGATSSGGPGRDMVRLWDLGTLREVWRGPHTPGISARQLSWRADGGMLAAASGTRKVHLLDAADGHEVATFPEPRPTATCATFAPDGNAVLVGRQDGSILLWRPPDANAEEWARTPGGYAYSLEISPDRKRVAAGLSNAVYVFESADPTKGHPLPDAPGVVWGMRFTPDGSQLVAAGASGIALWDPAAGGMVFSVKTSQRGVGGLDLSPDGRLIVSAGADGNIGLWETATGEPLASVRDDQGPVYAVAFLPGRRFCSAGADTQILIWSLDEVLPPPPAAVTEEAVLQAWEALAGEASAAYRAQQALAAGGEKAVAVFRDRLKPPPPPDEKRIRQLIADLDSDRFAAREAATAELRKIGRPAATLLRKALQDSASAEVRQRAEQLIAAMSGPQPLSPEEKRAIRAIAVLESVGGDAARSLLQSLDGPQVPPLVARQAHSALARLRGLVEN